MRRVLHKFEKDFRWSRGNVRGTAAFGIEADGLVSTTFGSGRNPRRGIGWDRGKFCANLSTDGGMQSLEMTENGYRHYNWDPCCG